MSVSSVVLHKEGNVGLEFPYSKTTTPIPKWNDTLESCKNWAMETSSEKFEPFLYLSLTTYIWQNWKRVFTACPYHYIIRLEAVSLKIPIILLKLWFLWICNIWGNFLKNRHFDNNCLIKNQLWKLFRIYFTHITVIIFHIANFVST